MSSSQPPQSSSQQRPTTSSSGAGASSAAASRRGSSSHTARATAEEKLLKDAAMAVSIIVGAVIILKSLAVSLAMYGSLLPVLYLYGLQTRPLRSTFDAKRELQCVLRGDALPEDHPDKPKNTGFMGFVTGAMAALTAEVLALPGYTVDLSDLVGVAWMATVTLPTSDLECVWIGCNHKWYYWGSSKISERSSGSGTAAPSYQHARMPERANVKIGKTNIQFDFGKQD